MSRNKAELLPNNSHATANISLLVKITKCSFKYFTITSNSVFYIINLNQHLLIFAFLEKGNVQVSFLHISAFLAQIETLIAKEKKERH